ncbi:DUF1343 domain-containing protein [Vagococcus lutrae]|uniref:exo-beta-N-acetylmuramidase NamZ family protein n=1 Tax=Vagococcus lutrae TaxID=81947 RepID=UPI00209682A7|nr:DUF1343 domain-containing protein [Vagococcus lutrae]MCO7151507.1 DUF1343 domain-containing protein [Vagococcus lutrae]MDT2812488.1 DUF1343 domain-containing protein [Vagococcus lutrae]MDT2819482.1 DUF1343 domain-containing protein [Vagococcus lutrae]MDT2844309.1 DUF1343 domain-containing protein [Vagococcus lutrae]WCG04370.1 DUF1343 domain-containing protein [Vagococcus lutrae]
MLDVKSGLERLKESKFEKELKGKRVGLITNVTGLTKKFESNVDILDSICDVCVLFAPEHGIRGEHQAGESVKNYYDSYFSKNVISLYGKERAPQIEDIDDLDILIYDIQDIGSRYYTYIYTMFLSMKIAKKADIKFMVLDRPNCLGGTQIIGNIMPKELYSFVGMLPIPNVYGMTVGELACYCNEELKVNADLTIVPLKNWTRGMEWKDTGLPWVMPSPNIPTPETAWIYTGTCLIEGTNLSEGRGTSKPFELVGAPWLNGPKLADKLNKLGLPGIKFRSTFFTPTFSKFAGELCEGVQMHIIDKTLSNPLLATLKLLEIVKELHGNSLEVDLPFEDSSHTFFEHLAGHKFNETSINKELLDDFNEKRLKYLLYK